jgi:hypothetical protein
MNPMTLTLPVDVWRVIHALVLEDKVPLRQAMVGVSQFEAELKKAAEGLPPAAAPETPPETGRAKKAR